MNIEDKDNIHHCTSCSLCAAVCPKDAISISTDSDGFYRPKIDAAKCVDCGLCRSVCYKYDDKIQESNSENLSKTDLYSAWAKDNEVLMSTTSGGVADLLARQLVKDGYKCVGVIYDGDKDIAQHQIATTEQETALFRGSKYIQSFTFPAFRQVVEGCKNERFAVFGTPCQIYAIDRYLRLRGVRDRHILIDLYCHGCPSILIWKKYIKEVKQEIGISKVDNVNFRSKRKGWGSGYILSVEANGKPAFYSCRKRDEFFTLFFCDQVLNDPCSDCRMRSTMDYTDIRLGDFWGRRYVLNDRGVSAVCLVTAAGNDLFEKIRPNLECEKQSLAELHPYQSWGKVYHPNLKLRSELLKQLQDESLPLKASVRTLYRYQGLKGRVKRIIKSAIRLMPARSEKRIKALFYRVRSLNFLILLSLILGLTALSGKAATTFGDESLRYVVSYKWGLIHKDAGDATLSLRRSGDRYKVSLTAKTRPWADKIYSVRDTLLGEIRIKDLRPLSYAKITHEKKKYARDDIRYSFSGDNTVGHTKCLRIKNGETNVTERTLTASGPVYDMLSIFYYLRQLNYDQLNKNKLYVATIFSGKKREKIKIRSIGKETITLKDKSKHESYHIRFNFTQDGGKKSSDDMDVWISTDDRHIPLYLVGTLPVGEVRAYLTAY